MSEAASPAATLTNGTRVGNYLVDKKIGEGGMGAVYLATHPELGRKAAIKVLLPEHSQQPDLVTRFFNEAKTAASLRHPSLVEVFDYGLLPNGAAYLVMDFLEGESLASRLTRVGRLSAEQAGDIGRQIAAGVAAAHEQGIVHRDLKPDNVFLVPDPENPGRERVKILDFGIAKLVMPNASLSQGSKAVRTSTGMLLGTPLYMAPEQCRGAGQIDHRADIYSVGCILFMMLTGRPPFNHEGVGEVLAAHLHEPVPSPRSLEPKIPLALEAVVVRALDKKPEARFQTMSELAAELQRAAAAPLAVAESETLPVPTRNRGGLIALAAIAVVGAAGVFLWQQRSRPPAVATGSGAAPAQAPPQQRPGVVPGAPDHKEGTGTVVQGQTPPAGTTDPPGGQANPPAATGAQANVPAQANGSSNADAAPGSGEGAGAGAPEGTEHAGAGGVATKAGQDRREAGKQKPPAKRSGPSGLMLLERALNFRTRGNEAEALLAYRSALAADDLTGEQRSEAEQKVISLSKKFGHLEVICDVDGMVISVGGKILGRTPLRQPILLKPGRHDLMITKPGYRTIQKGVFLKGGERSTLRFSGTR